MSKFVSLRELKLEDNVEGIESVFNGDDMKVTRDYLNSNESGITHKLPIAIYLSHGHEIDVLKNEVTILQNEIESLRVKIGLLKRN